MVLLVDGDARHLCRTERTLDEELHVVGEGDHVDVLVAELAHDTVHTATLDTHTGSYGVDAVVVALDSHLGAVSRHAGHTTDSDQTVGNLGHLSLK